jgi:hypothetical protein
MLVFASEDSLVPKNIDYKVDRYFEEWSHRTGVYLWRRSTYQRVANWESDGTGMTMAVEMARRALVSVRFVINNERIGEFL